MAFAVTVLKKTVFGDQRIHHLQIVPDGAEANVDTGLRVVHNAIVCQASAATAAWNYYVNENSSGTSSNGTIGISGVASGDVLYAVVFGV